MKDSRIILGEKVGMTQVFDENNCLIPVTVVAAFSCKVTQLKTEETDGYAAVQIAFGEKKLKNETKAKLGHLKKSKVESCRGLREFRAETSAYQLGDVLDVSLFEPGEKIDVIGVTKGHGFQGVVKRHEFSGGPASHGSMFHRRGGSFGNCQWPGHVYKGRKMPGHDGAETRTVQNLKVVDVLKDRNLLLLKGSIPGANGGVLVLRKAKKVKLAR